MYVITTLSSQQPITDQHMPGAGAKHVHVQLCIALHLPFDMQKNFFGIMLSIRVCDTVRVSIKS